MSVSDRTKPPAEWLQQLNDSGHWERLIRIASDSLAIDPHDLDTHRHIAWAYAQTDRLPELWRHTSVLLAAEPDDARHHHLAAIYFLESKRPKKAAPHIDTLLRLEPYSATYHYIAGVHALRTSRIPKAREHLRNARALAPDWATAAHLQIQIDGMHQTAASDAWDRIRRLEEALSLDPQDAAMLTSIGEIHLNELERPRDAESFFRRALYIDPTNRPRQRLLLKSMQARSLFYRTLALPATAVSNILAAIRGGRVNVIFLVVAIKAVAAFLVWLLLVGALFTPAARIYEWLVLAEIPRARPFPLILAWLETVRAWPRWVRLALSSITIASLWSGIFGVLGNIPWLDSVLIMGSIFGVHLAFVGLFVGALHLRARFGLWQHTRRRRRAAARAPLSSLPA